MGMLEIPGTLRAGSIKMDADATGGGDSIGNSLSQKFSFVDSVPATDGITTGNPYAYTITGTGNSFYYAKMTLSGKDSRGTHRTAEIEVFNGELQSLFLSNIGAYEINVAVYGDTVRVTPTFSETWFFTNHVEGYSGTLNGGNTFYGERGIFMGGDPPGADDTIEYINIATTGNATDFGETTQARYYTGGTSGSGRGMNINGTTPTAQVDTADYITIGTLGDAADFGDTSAIHTYGQAMCDGSRVCHGGDDGYDVDYIDAFNIMTLGNSFDFGERFETTGGIGACSDGNRGLWLSGYRGGRLNHIEFISMQTLGDATDFGEQVTALNGGASTSDGSRCLRGGGHDGGTTYPDAIDIITIGTLGNGVDWGGELTQGRGQTAACSNASRAVFAGGNAQGSGTAVNVIDYVYFNSPGVDAVDFGNLTTIVGGFDGQNISG